MDDGDPADATDLPLVAALVADDTLSLAEALAYLGMDPAAVPDDDPPGGRFPGRPA